jgi:hypothetical protein
LVHIYGQDTEKSWIRFGSLVLFTSTYLAFAITFGVRLSGWNDDELGHCYDASTVAFTDRHHPGIDHIYLAITCTYCLCSLLMCLTCHATLSVADHPDKFHRLVHRVASRHTAERLAPSIVLVALLQYPLHLYMVIALRAVNEGRLTGGSENAWGFGQIVALILMSATFLECVRGIAGR